MQNPSGLKGEYKADTNFQGETAPTLDWGIPVSSKLLPRHFPLCIKLNQVKSKFPLPIFMSMLCTEL